ncbi:phage tail assembly protein T [Candidatus Nitrospira bockiana]
MAYYTIDPFGQRRGDLQAAIVASTIANAYAPKGRRYKRADFMPTFGEAPAAQSPEQILSMFQAIAQRQETARG